MQGAGDFPGFSAIEPAKSHHTNFHLFQLSDRLVFALASSLPPGRWIYG